MHIVKILATTLLLSVVYILVSFTLSGTVIHPESAFTDYGHHFSIAVSVSFIMSVSLFWPDNP